MALRERLNDRSLAKGAVIRVIRSWPGGPARGTVQAGIPMARAKQLLAMKFIELVEEEETPMPCGTGKGKPKPRPRTR